MKPVLCPPVDTLRRYSHGDLEDGDADTVDRHLAECDECLAKLDRLSKIDTLFGELRGRTPSEETPHALHVAVSASVARLSADAIAGAAVVGGYTLHEEIGRGGMGQVFRATHPRLPVDVAIKLLRAGQDSDVLRRRFESERETLARMDHPNIAKVFDAGIGEDGRPFIAMELVRGTTLGTYLATVPSGWRSKLELFRQVCSAIQHAHQKGAIHRDIKPSNVLLSVLDGEIVPKVIDFGVACAVDSNSTGHTGEGFAVGTLQYMSPEQTEHDSSGIDTRTDVYSLGVLLYEMIAGRTPLAAVGGNRKVPIEAMRLIREAEPPPASQGALLDGAARRVRQELNWIALRALEKDPARRYETAAALADDIRRLLVDEPVEAAPPSRRYRLKKFARRNRAAFVGGSLVALALCAGIAGTTVQMYRARDAESASKGSARDADDRRILAEIAERQSEIDSGAARRAEGEAKADRNRAVEAEADSDAFNKFLVDYVLVAARPRNAKSGLGRTVTLAEALETAESKIDEAFANRPLAEAKARIALAETWLNYSRFTDAEKHYLRALAILEARLPADRPLWLQCRQHIVVLYHNTSRIREALAIAEELLPLFVQEFGAESTGTLTLQSDLCHIYLLQGRTADALALARHVLERRRAAHGPDHRHVLAAMALLGTCLSEAGKTDEATRIYEEVLERRTKTLGTDNRDTIGAMNDVASMRLRQRKFSDAISLLERASELANEHLGETHRTTNAILTNLGAALSEKSRLPEAIRALETSRDVQLKQFGERHVGTMNAMSHLGIAYRKAKRFPEAIETAERLVRVRAAVSGPNHSKTINEVHFLGIAVLASGDASGAIPHLRRVAEHNMKTKGTNDFQTANAVYYLAQAIVDSVGYGRAEEWLEPMMPYATGDGAKTNMARYIRQLYASCLVRKARFEEAERLLERHLTAADREKPNSATAAIGLSDLGLCRTARRQFADAEKMLLAAQKTIDLGYRQRHAYLTFEVARENHRRLVDLYAAWGKPDLAAEWQMKLERLREVAPQPRAASSSN